MLADPVNAARAIATWAGIDACHDRLIAAIDDSTADRMRSLESTMPRRIKKQRRMDRNFVRVATKGSWRKELPERSAKLIEKRWNALMTDIGYLPNEGE